MGRRKRKQHLEDYSDFEFNELPKPSSLKKMYKNFMKEQELVINNYQKK